MLLPAKKKTTHTPRWRRELRAFFFWHIRAKKMDFSAAFFLRAIRASALFLSADLTTSKTFLMTPKERKTLFPWWKGTSDRNKTNTTTETLPVRSSVITPTTRGLQTLQHNLHCLCKLSRPHIVNQVKIWISKQRWQTMDGETLSAGLYLHHRMLQIKGQCCNQLNYVH